MTAGYIPRQPSESQGAYITHKDKVYLMTAISWNRKLVDLLAVDAAKSEYLSGVSFDELSDPPPCPFIFIGKKHCRHEHDEDRCCSCNHMRMGL